MRENTKYVLSLLPFGEKWTYHYSILETIPDKVQ